MNTNKIKLLGLFIILLFLNTSLKAQVPTYYNNVNLNLTGISLKNELATKIANTHTTYLSYTPGVWNALKQTDVDPTNNRKVILIYGYNDTDGDIRNDRTRGINSNGGGSTDWNREHVFPKSLGNPNLGTSGPGADAHHLRPCDTRTNSTRSNRKFTNGSGNAKRIGSFWYPGDEWKGDVARMMMYMYLRYGNQCLPSNVANGSRNSVDNNMIDVLLAWNAEDPVSPLELQRNPVIENLQGNRNPFIDNPAFATKIWGGPQAQDRFNTSVTPSPEISVLGNSNPINDGATTTQASNNTDFGTTNTSGGAVVKNFTIRNLGNATLTLSSNPTVTGSDFTITSNPNLSIAPSGSTNFSITFNPTSDGNKTATVTILNNDSDENPYTFTIKGVGSSGSGGGGGGGSCGTEDFANSNATRNYTNNSFTGNNGISWSYTESRNGNNDTNGSGISLPALMLRNTSSKITSSSISGGIGNFSLKLYKGFTGRGNRQVELFINGISRGKSTAFNDYNAHTFTVNNINVTGNITIEIRNATRKQVIIDDIQWTCYSVANEPEIVVEGNNNAINDGDVAVNSNNNTDFGATSINTPITKTFKIKNTGIQTLTLSAIPNITGANAGDFSITSNPNLSIAAGSETTFDVTFNSAVVGGKNATINILSNDTDEATFNFNISANVISGGIDCAIVRKTIFQQDFETSPATPTLTFTMPSTATYSTTNATRPNAPMYIGNRGVKVNRKTSVIEFDAVDLSGYTNPEFSIRLGSFSKSSGNGADDRDYVKLFVSTNNGASYSEEIHLIGNNNARWSFTSGTRVASVSYDGDNAPNTFAPASGGDTTDGYSTLKISNIPTGNQIKFKIELKNDKNNEIWAIDDVKITAGVPSLTKWNGAWTNNSPTSTKKAILENDYTMTSNNTINTCECEITNGVTLTITGNKFLKVENNIINNGTIIVEDDGSLLQVSPTATISGSGNIIVKRKTSQLISKNVFTYWSSPIKNASLQQVAVANNYYSFDTSLNPKWRAETKNTIMNSGVGYIAKGPVTGTYPLQHTAIFNGSELNNGTINVPLKYSNNGNNDDDWNLVGNPYPSSINAARLISSNSNLGGTLYFWTHKTDASATAFSQNDYVSWNGTGAVGNCSGCVLPTGIIASGQGFFVQATGAGNMSFTNTMRVNTSTNFYKTPNNNKDRIWLNVTKQGVFSQLLIGFINGATDGIDRLYDGLKLEGNNASFYSIIEDKPFSIQGLPKLEEGDAQEIPLGIKVASRGKYTISIDNLEGEVLNKSTIELLDNKEDKVYNLKEKSHEFFIEESGTFNNRFVLLVNRRKALSVNNVIAENSLEIIEHDNKIVIKSNKNIESVNIYNILGKKLVSEKPNDTKVNISSNKLKTNNILIVKTILENGQVISNKFIKNN